jgi:hypothetical protein
MTWRADWHVDAAPGAYVAISSGGGGAVADTTLTIYGVGHLTGKTVRIVICGVDCGTAVVAAGGSATFTYKSDAGGIVSPSYLEANPSEGTDHDVTFNVYDGSGTHAVTVPLLVGLDYTAKGQLIRPTVEQVMQAGPGAGLGKTRRAVWASLLVRDLLALKIGTDFTNMYQMSITTDGGITPELAIATDAPFTGVLVANLDDPVAFDSALAWQSSGSAGVVIGAAATFLDGASR